jgi:hypothetical protein
MEALSAFLDDVTGGGESVRSKLAAEGISSRQGHQHPAPSQANPRTSSITPNRRPRHPLGPVAHGGRISPGSGVVPCWGTVMAETFLLAEEKHVQEPFLLHRTRSFRVARSFHDNCPGSAAPPGDLCRIARYVRSGKRAGHVRTERRTADLARPCLGPMATIRDTSRDSHAPTGAATASILAAIVSTVKTPSRLTHLQPARSQVRSGAHGAQPCRGTGAFVEPAGDAGVGPA